jgi:Transposase DDE domain
MSKKNTTWKHYEGNKEFPISGKYLNQIHNKFTRLGVYKEINKQLVNHYLKKGKEIKLKIQNIDSTFVPNKGGSVSKNPRKDDNEKPIIDFNSYNGRKKYLKVSVITDSIGTPLVSTIFGANQHDIITLEETVNNLPVNLNTLKNSKVNRFKQTFLADSGYDSKSNETFLKLKGYNPIICKNKRGTKNKEKLAKMKLSGKKLEIYKKRGTTVEPFFSWIKNFPLINNVYSKSVASYENLFTLACIILISRRIT